MCLRNPCVQCRNTQSEHVIVNSPPENQVFTLLNESVLGVLATAIVLSVVV